MQKEIIENHNKYLERINLFRDLGYDIEKEMDFIIEKSLPFNGKILDVGTGKGRFAVALAKRGYSFTSVDISEEEQRYAKLNIEYFALQKQIDFQISNAEQLSFKNQSFDTIFSINVVHHLSSPYKVMDEIARVVRINGKIIISDFTQEGLDLIGRVHRNEGHEHIAEKTTIDEISGYLEGKNFKVKRQRTVFQDTIIAGSEDLEQA